MYKGLGHSSPAECLLSMHEVWGSIPSIAEGESENRVSSHSEDQCYPRWRSGSDHGLSDGQALGLQAFWNLAFCARQRGSDHQGLYAAFCQSAEQLKTV